MRWSGYIFLPEEHWSSGRQRCEKRAGKRARRRFKKYLTGRSISHNRLKFEQALDAGDCLLFRIQQFAQVSLLRHRAMVRKAMFAVIALVRLRPAGAVITGPLALEMMMGDMVSGQSVEF